MSTAVLSIGSNMGNRMGNLALAYQGFADVLVASSAVFSTPAWGPIEQADFLNAVLIVDADDVTASDWLGRGALIEQEAQRRRDVRWGPRTLDIDVISVADAGEVVRSDIEELTLPHPRASQRAFVLVPWLDADPNALLWHEGWMQPVNDVMARLPVDDRTAIVRTDHDLRASHGG